MRRTVLLLGLIAVLSLGTMAFGLVTSGAWFTDSAASSGAILISGSLDLNVTGGPLRAENLEPSEKYSQLGLICAQNLGTTPLKYRGLFESPDPLTNDLLKYLTLKLEQHTTGHWVTLQEILGNPGVETDGLTYYFKFPGQDPDLVHHPIIQGKLAPGEKTCYRMTVRLDKATPNEQQGKSIRFFLHINATQPGNPGW